MVQIYLQVYFLLILLNLLGAAALNIQWVKEKWPRLGVSLQWLEGLNARLMVGVFCFLFGFLALIAVLPGDIPVIGDLIPSLAAMFSGTALVLGYFREKSDGEKPSSRQLEGVILSYKNIFGTISAGAGVVHFLVPNWVFF